MILAQVTHPSAFSRELEPYIGQPYTDPVSGNSFCIVQANPSGKFVFARVRYHDRGEPNWSIREDILKFTFDQGVVMIVLVPGTKFTTAFGNKLLSMPANCIAVTPQKAKTFDEAGIG